MVSVIIPVYNGEQFLAECLDSVIEQSYKNLEIIIIDDGSTDSSYEICRKYAEKDERIRLICQENAGVSAARNQGLGIAKGDYITFVDADDKLTYHAVEILRKNAECGIDLVVGSHEEFRGKKGKKIIRGSELIDLDRNIDTLPRIANTLTTPWGKLFQRDKIIENKLEFKHGLPYGEDNMFNLQYCERIGNVRMIEDIVYLYRKGGEASSIRYYANMHKISVALLNAFFQLMDKKKCKKFNVKQEIKKSMTGCVYHYAVNCSYKEALKKTKETFALYGDEFGGRVICGHEVENDIKSYLNAQEHFFLIEVYKTKFKKIVVKRSKILCSRVFKVRI